MLDLTTFLRQLANAFARQSLPWLVMRNHALLPETNIGGDIDFLIPPVSSCDARHIVDASGNVAISTHCERSWVRNFWLANVCQRQGERGLQVDFIDDIVFRGIPLLDTDAILARRQPHPRAPEFLSIPEPLDEAILIFVQSYLVTGSMKERYRDQVASAFAAQQEQAISRLAPAMGKRAATAACGLVSSACWSGVESMIWKWRGAIVARAMRHKPLETVAGTAAYFRAETRIARDDFLTFNPVVAGAQDRRDQLAQSLGGLAKTVRAVPGDWKRAGRRRLPELLISPASIGSSISCEMPGAGEQDIIDAMCENARKAAAIYRLRD